MDELMIKIDNVKKQYTLGAIGGTTLRDELQRRRAKRKRLEDPTKKIGAKDVNIGEKFMALNGVSFEVKKGEAVGIIGHNGAGKSTLLKLITRITAPTEGDIYLNGRVASMLEVGTGFHPELTGRENVYLNGAILGMTKAEIDSKMEDIIDFSEVREFIDTPVKRYSSGMYVKLAFSVAAHLDSEIMIMDEVLAVGDMAFQKKCLDKMRDAAKKEGRTVLYVSHNMNTIRQLCDRCVVLDKGKVIYQGDVDTAIEIYLQGNASPMGTDIDLSCRRMDHLPAQTVAKFQRLVLTGKTEPVYEFGEDIPFEVTVKSTRPIQNPCVRLEIRGGNDQPVGASYAHDLEKVEADQLKTYTFSLKNHGLVTGKYKALLVLYEVNEFGTYDDLDAVFPAFTFEVVNTENRLKIAWNHGHWGLVNFEQI